MNCGDLTREFFQSYHCKYTKSVIFLFFFPQPLDLYTFLSIFIVSFRWHFLSDRGEPGPLFPFSNHNSGSSSLVPSSTPRLRRLLPDGPIMSRNSRSCSCRDSHGLFVPSDVGFRRHPSYRRLLSDSPSCSFSSLPRDEEGGQNVRGVSWDITVLAVSRRLFLPTENLVVSGHGFSSRIFSHHSSTRYSRIITRPISLTILLVVGPCRPSLITGIQIPRSSSLLQYPWNSPGNPCTDTLSPTGRPRHR